MSKNEKKQKMARFLSIKSWLMALKCGVLANFAGYFV
jgi:hypothetical protein